MKNKYEGNDNYGRSKTDYLSKIAMMDDKELSNECYNMIYQSAHCNNNPKADWHWMVDACYDESKKRGSNIYSIAYDLCYKNHSTKKG